MIILLYHVCSLFEKENIVGIEVGGFTQAEAVFHDCHMQVVRSLSNFAIASIGLVLNFNSPL